MATLKDIKERQIAAAQEEGKTNPYQASKTTIAVKVAAAIEHKTIVLSTPSGKLAELKAKQLEKDPEAYKRKLIGVDMADSQDQTVTLDINLFEQLQAAMQTDVARIKGINKLDDKQEMKRKLLPNYLPFVNNYIAEEHDYPCDIAVQVMIWLFDVCDIENALKVGIYLVNKTPSIMPTRFNRDLPSFIIDETYEWSNSQLKDEQTASPYLDELVNAIEENGWVNAFELHPLLISKSYVILAKHKEREGDLKACVSLCERAEAANPEGAGVKTMKERAQKALAKAKE